MGLSGWSRWRADALWTNYWSGERAGLVVSSRTLLASENVRAANFLERRLGESRRLPLPRTPPNRARRGAGAADSPSPQLSTPIIGPVVALTFGIGTPHVSSCSLPRCQRRPRRSPKFAAYGSSLWPEGG